MTELHELTIAEAADLIRARRLSPVDLTRALLERIERLDHHVHAFITVTPELALSQARAAEAEISQDRWRGRLHGIPYGLKDIYSTAGIRTTGHSRVGEHHVPRRDATVTAKLNAAGAVLMGKLATYQFTHGGPSFDPPWPPARNPWNLEHDAGGSSSGSAAAVAASMVPGAMGSDTGGSVRIPASFCGVAGLKPTFGLVSRAGVIPNSFSCDHCGPLARTVEDCAILLQGIAGFDAADPASVDVPLPDYRTALAGDLRGIRIGVLRHFWEEDVYLGDEIPPMMERVIEVFRSLGARIEDARMRPLQYYYDIKNIIIKAEVFSVHQQNLRMCSADFGPDFLGITLGGSLLSAVDYVQAQRERSRILDEMEALYRDFDLLLTANIGPAPRLIRKPPSEFWQVSRAPASICIPFSLSGGPALSVCSGFARNGLPLGIQIAARPFEEALVLRAGFAYEQATPWRQGRPNPDEADVAVPKTQPPLPVGRVPASSDLQSVLWYAERAGLCPDPAQLEQLRSLQPHAEAMAERLREPRPYDLEIVNMLQLPADGVAKDPP